MVNRFREMDRVKVFSVAVFVLLVIQPILELDYLANDFLKGYGLIVPSTIIFHSYWVVLLSLEFIQFFTLLE